MLIENLDFFSHRFKEFVGIQAAVLEVLKTEVNIRR